MSVRLPVLLLAAIPLAACASQGPGQVARTYDPASNPAACLLKPFSRSADGSVVKADMEAGINAGFAAADLNHDGGLDYQELNALNTAHAASCDQTNWINYDPSGRMGVDQYGARYRTAFEQSDTNMDGIATGEEITMSKRQPPKVKRKAPADEPSEPQQSPQTGYPGAGGNSPY